MDRLFGTDGVRGVAGDWPLDPPTIARLGAAAVRTQAQLQAQHRRPVRVLLGRDTRESGEWIAREFARGATAEGALVTSAGVLPTPGIAYLTQARAFDLGVVLSASHNPYADNGIKIFAGSGEKFGEEQERRVEALVADTSWTVDPEASARIETANLVEPYLAHLRRLLPSAGPLAGARVAVDMANGATTAGAIALFESLGFVAIPLGDRPDGRNINLACGSTHPARLAATVTAEGCMIGIAFDGDGDRAIFVDHRGRVVDGDAVLLILALHLQRRRLLTGQTVVATVMSNIGLEIALREYGIALLRTPVGDKYVMEAMLAGGYVLGGEQSGHVIMTEHLPTGDGMATALAILRVMADTGLDLADLASALQTFPQTLVNVRVREKTPIERVPAIQAAIGRVEAALDGRGRVLVRYSGTEPLLRIMLEGENQATVQAWAEEIADAVRETLA
ncbi:MAG TPA: phosphoglucosamine mutase [Vicinamibacterales bacterium]|nr:phosphoglucosamine mutase [Vicinamibacterales bacterium]